MQHYIQTHTQSCEHIYRCLVCLSAYFSPFTFYLFLYVCLCNYYSLFVSLLFTLYPIVSFSVSICLNLLVCLFRFSLPHSISFPIYLSHFIHLYIPIYLSIHLNNPQPTAHKHGEERRTEGSKSPFPLSAPTHRTEVLSPAGHQSLSGLGGGRGEW